VCQIGLRPGASQGFQAADYLLSPQLNNTSVVLDNFFYKQAVPHALKGLGHEIDFKTFDKN
jgi:hypothetical protein